MKKHPVCSTLRKLRIKAKLSQMELADIAGITNTSYQRYEYGERIPNVLIAISIANALDTTVEKIWTVH